MVDFNSLPKSYYTKQLARIEDLRRKLQDRTELVRKGLKIPDSGDLPIGQGKRLSAAVMFMDICSFSTRASESQIDQDNILRIISFFFPEMIKIIGDYGGVVEKNTGDGLMAYFPDIVGEHTTGPHKALSAALSMFYAAKTILNPTIISSGLTPIDFRICMDYGHITIAEVGAARRFRGIVAVGTTANIASKMLSAAGKNEILFGEAFLTQIPLEWRQNYTSLKESNTGWTYTSDQRPYPFYVYNGRWTKPM